MHPVLAAFPRRPLQLRPGRRAFGGWLLAIGGLLLFGGFIVMVGLEIVPGIRDDFAIRATAKPAPDIRIVSGRCRSRVFLFQSCDLTLAARGKAGQTTRELHYLFVEPHMGAFSAMPMADPAQPALVGTDLGLDRLWNRVITAIAGVILACVLILGGFVGARQGRAGRQALAAMSGRALEPVAVRFLGTGNGPSWTVQDEQGRSFAWPVGKSDRPFVLDPARGLVLGLRQAPGGPVFPLDETLRLVTLTAEERARVLAARGSPGPS